MASEVAATGKGFLTSGGQVKDKRTLEAENKIQTKKKEEGAESSRATEAEFSEKSVSKAIGSVKSRFTEQANSFISTVNSTDAKLKKAAENVEAQEEKAKELKVALKEGDQGTADKRREELQELQAERDAIAQEIEQDNAAKATERRKSLSLGNQQRAVVEVKKAEFSKTDQNQDLESKEGVDKLIDSLKSDKEAIKVQRDDIKEVRKAVNAVVKEVKTDLDKIEKSSINSINEAQRAAEKVATDIVKAGSQRSLVSNIDEDVVKSLVSA